MNKKNQEELVATSELVVSDQVVENESTELADAREISTRMILEEVSRALIELLPMICNTELLTWFAQVQHIDPRDQNLRPGVLELVMAIDQESMKRMRDAA